MCTVYYVISFREGWYGFRKPQCGDPEHRITLWEIYSIKTENIDGYIIKLSKYTPATHPLFMPAEVMSQILYAYVKEQRRPCPDTNSWWKYRALMTKFKVIQMSWIHVTNCPMVIHSCVSHGMIISKDKKCGPNTNYVKNPINVTLRSKVNVVSASWNHETHCLMVMDPCAECQSKKR